MPCKQFLLAIALSLCTAPTLPSAETGVGPDRRDILGGERADPLVYPSVVRVAAYGAGITRCTGTLISETWVLTAGHCVDGYKASRLTITNACLGDVQVTHGGVDRFACRIVVHDLYDPFDTPAPDHDVALLEITPLLGAPTAPWRWRRLAPVWTNPRLP